MLVNFVQSVIERCVIYIVPYAIYLAILIVTPDTTALVNSFISSAVFATISPATAACTPTFFVATLTVINAAIFTAAT